MAVGSKGSFATVDPNQGIIDVGGMARRESARQSEIQDKKNLLEGRFLAKTRDIGDALSKPEPKETGQLTYDQINFKAASLLREEQYKVLNKIGGSRLGEGMSLPEMRAEASKYESKFNNYADKMSMMKPAIDNFMEVVSDDKLSRAIGEDFTGEDGIGTKILNGSIDDVILDKDGEPLLIVNGKRMTVDRLHGFFSNPILKRDLTDDANTTSDELVSRITERVGAVDDNLEFYQTRLEEGMDSDQVDEVREKGQAIAKDPNFVGDLWFQYTQEEFDEGQKGVYTPDDLTEEQQQQLAEWSGNKLVTLVNNRFKKTIEDSFDYTERGKAIDRANKRREKEAKQKSDGFFQIGGASRWFTSSTGSNASIKTAKVNLRLEEGESFRVGDKIYPNLTISEIGVDNESGEFEILGNTQLSTGAKKKIEDLLVDKVKQNPNMNAQEIRDFVSVLNDEEGGGDDLLNDDLAVQLLMNYTETLKEKGLIKQVNGKTVFEPSEEALTITEDLVSNFGSVSGKIARGSSEEVMLAKKNGLTVTELREALKSEEETEEEDPLLPPSSK